MVFYVAYLEQKKFIVVKEQWVENPEILKNSKIFYSPQQGSVADFSLPLSYYFDNNKTTCYNAFLSKSFSEYFINFYNCLYNYAKSLSI